MAPYFYFGVGRGSSRLCSRLQTNVRSSERGQIRSDEGISLDLAEEQAL